MIKARKHLDIPPGVNEFLLVCRQGLADLYMNVAPCRAVIDQIVRSCEGKAGQTRLDFGGGIVEVLKGLVESDELSGLCFVR